jgi:hypothetical protein
MFMLDHNLIKSAQYTYDIHIRRQILELTMVIQAARHQLGLDVSHIPFTVRYKSHIFTKWIMMSLNNYLHVIKYCSVLQTELYYRGYPNKNKCITYLEKNKDNKSTLLKVFKSVVMTPYPQFMPPVFYHKHSIMSYRMYYFYFKRYKLPFCVSWKNRSTPYWYNDEYFIQNNQCGIHSLIDSSSVDFTKHRIVKKK